MAVPFGSCDCDPPDPGDSPKRVTCFRRNSPRRFPPRRVRGGYVARLHARATATASAAFGAAASADDPARPGGACGFARYGREAPAINGGVVWRVYTAKPDAAGAYRLVKEDRAVSPTFVLPPGDYVVHASFGLASAAKTVQLRAETVREVFEIPAGGIRLEGRVGDVRIPPARSFSMFFNGSQFDTGGAAAACAQCDDRRRRAASGGHLLHRLQLRRRQFRRALRHPCAGRQADRHRGQPPRRRDHAQARERRGARRLPTRNGRCSRPAAT